MVVQCVTPYPKTDMRRQLIEAGLVVNADDFTRYNGFICNVRTHKMSERELAFAMNVEYLKLYLNPGLPGPQPLPPKASDRKPVQPGPRDPQHPRSRPEHVQQPALPVPRLRMTLSGPRQCDRSCI